MSGFGLPFREPRRPEGHPLIGHMREATEEDVREMLARRPPTLEEADAIAAEELSWWHRERVFQLLRSYAPSRRMKWGDE